MQPLVELKHAQISFTFFFSFSWVLSLSSLFHSQFLKVLRKYFENQKLLNLCSLTSVHHSALSGLIEHLLTFLFFKQKFIYFNWRLITILQCFCHSLTWICHRCTCVPHPEPPSHLPLPIPSLWVIQCLLNYS